VFNPGDYPFISIFMPYRRRVFPRMFLESKAGFLAPQTGFTRLANNWGLMQRVLQQRIVFDEKLTLLKNRVLPRS